MNDAINALFELGAAAVTWMNVYRLYRDKVVKGVYWQVWGFYSAWGLWNLYFYPSLGQTLSFYAGIVLVSGNIAWFVMAKKIPSE